MLKKKLSKTFMYFVPLLILGLFLIEINSFIFVLRELSSLNGLGLLRYHSQRGLNCYLLTIRDLMPSSIGIPCFESSKMYINKYNTYYQSGFMHTIYHNKKYHSLENVIKLEIAKYLPNDMLYDNSSASLPRTFIPDQAQIKDNIVGNVTTLLNTKIEALKNIYITEFSLLFLFLFSTVGYITIYFKSNIEQNNAKTEKIVINQLCHELRTSLTPIEMYTREFMQSDRVDFEQKQFINNFILTSIKQHKYILVSRLDFEKMLSNDYELKLENIDLIKLLKSYITETEQYILLSNKPLKIVLQTSIESLCIRMDKLIFHYIITNILRNSVKYSSNGTIRLNVDMVPSNHIKIEIADDGIGLSTDMISILNGEKNQIIRNKTELDSYGLGIRFTKKLVTLLRNGYFYIESKGENKGTMSTITFDAENADTMYIKERTENISDFVMICITDDCPIVRNVMKRTLQSVFKKMTILQFENGENLLKHTFDKTHTYIHVLDEHMHSTGGKLCGHEVSTILKSRPDEIHYTISMSGNDIDMSCNYFDIVWNKPPPSNEVIEQQLRDLIRPEVFNLNRISVHEVNGIDCAT